MGKMINYLEFSIHKQHRIQATAPSLKPQSSCNFSAGMRRKALCNTASADGPFLKRAPLKDLTSLLPNTGRALFFLLTEIKLLPEEQRIYLEDRFFPFFNLL